MKKKRIFKNLLKEATKMGKAFFRCPYPGSFITQYDNSPKPYGKSKKSRPVWKGLNRD